MNRANLNTALRTEHCWNRYCSAPNPDVCIFCEKNGVIVKTFDHWYIMTNAFPYDAVAERHDMLIPLDHYRREEDLTSVAVEELETLLGELEDAGDYDCIMRNFTVAQSVPAHLHYHLIKWRRT